MGQPAGAFPPPGDLPERPGRTPQPRSRSPVQLLTSPRPAGLDPAALLPHADRAAAVAARGRAAADASGAFPHDAFDALHAEGLLAAPLKRTHGGWGLGTEPGGSLALLDVLRRIGRGSLVVGRVYEGHVNALGLVQRFGTPAQAARAAADARAGRVFGIWHAHPGENVRLVPEETEGASGASRYRLAGSKLFASGTGRVSRPVVTAVLPDGAERLVVVPLQDPHAEDDPAVDRSWWTATGMRASASHRVAFDGITVTEGDLVGTEGVYRREPWYSAGAIRFAAVQLGGAEALAEAARAHLTRRGRTEHAAQQRRAARLAIDLETGRLWLARAAAAWDEALKAGPEPPAEVTAHVVATGHRVRTAIAEIARATLDGVHRAVGAAGMLAPHPVEGVGRDLAVYLCQPAPDAALEAAGRHALDAGLDLDAPLRGLGCG